MTTPYDLIKSAILGNPINPLKKPDRVGTVKAFAEMQRQLEASQAGALVFDTYAALDAVTAVPSANIMAWVMTGDEAGIYQNTGTTMAPVFTRRGDIPQFVVTGINVGAGTANAIQVTTDIPVPIEDGRALLIIPILADNTVSPPTVAINGGTALPIVSNSGNNVVVAGLLTGMFVAGFISSDKFRLLSDQASAAVLAAAEDAANRAEAAAASVDIRNVADRTALKALDTTLSTLAFIKEIGREGFFKWTSGDFAAQITADTAEGVYIKATAIAANAGAWVRVGAPTVYHFGGSAGADSAAAIAAMASAVGFVRFPMGLTLIGSDVTIDVPMFFDTGATVTVAATKTLTIRNRINAPKQQIFAGSGSVKLRINAPTGEDSKVCHIAWWGVFPQGTASVDLAPAINKAFDAYVGQNREGVMEFDVGSYRIAGKITVPRGVHLKGQGSRRTIFDLIGDGYTAIEMGGDAGKITGIMFEQPIGLEGTRAGILIDCLSYIGCVIDDVWLWGTDTGIKTAGNDTRISRIAGRYNYGSNPAAGSSLVWLADGSRHVVSDLLIGGQTYAPDYIVKIGDGNSASMANISISGIVSTERSIPVKIDADSANVISLVTISDIALQGDTTAAAVHIATSGSGSCRSVSISGIAASSSVTALVQIDQDSSGDCRYITIGDSVIYGTGDGVVLSRTAGTLSEVTISPSVNTLARTTPVKITGAVDKVHGVWGYLSLADDTAASFVAGVIGGQVRIDNLGSGAGFPVIAQSGLIIFDVGSSAAIAKGYGGANLLATGTSALTGTTGTDANTNVAAVNDGKIYIENRSGGAVVCRYSVLAP